MDAYSPLLTNLIGSIHIYNVEFMLFNRAKRFSTNYTFKSFIVFKNLSLQKKYSS